MNKAQARGVNKDACRRDTYAQIRSFHPVLHRKFGILLGPEAGDVAAIVATGFMHCNIVGFEKDDEVRWQAECALISSGRSSAVQTFKNALVSYTEAKHTDAFYDWCSGAREGLENTIRALRANWLPFDRGGSTITVGVTTRGNDEEVWRVKRELKDWQAADSSWVTAEYLFRGLQPIVEHEFGLGLTLRGIRDYKGLGKGGENTGAHMVYVTFLTHEKKFVGNHKIERLHYYNGNASKPGSAQRDTSERSAIAKRAWATRRSNKPAPIEDKAARVAASAAALRRRLAEHLVDKMSTEQINALVEVLRERLPNTL